jgi:hypothetical protein
MAKTVFENVKIKWPKLGANTEDNFNQDGQQWSVTIVLDTEQAKKWRAAKASPEIKVSEDGEETIGVKRGCTFKKSGDAKPAPIVVDKFGDSVDTTIIGNGSVCNVEVSTYEYNFKGRAGVGSELRAVQVLELVEYTGGDGGEGSSFSFAPKSAVSMSEVTAGMSDDEPPF